VGATGSVIITKLLHELIRVNGRYGIATMCIGGGQGITTVWERV
jgi:acetyl-CoA C-acetyltransferase